MTASNRPEASIRKKYRHISRRVLAVGLLMVLPVACAAAKPIERAMPIKTAPPITTGASLAGNYLAGRFAQSQNDIGDAVDFLKKALDKSPAAPNLLRRVFIILAAEGRMDEASAMAERIIKVKADAPIAGLELVAGLIGGGRFGEAEKKLTGLPSDGINSYMAPLLRAWVSLALGGNGAKALKILKPLGDKKGSRALYDIHAALIEDRTGKKAKAEKYYLAAADAQGGFSLRLVKLLGNFYERSGNTNKARKLYLKLKKENPRSRLLDPDLARLERGEVPRPMVLTPRDGAAESFFGVASSLRRQNAHEMGLIFGRIALSLRPRFQEARIMVAGILEESGRLLAANGVYSAIDPKSPFSWAARMRVALNLNKLGRTKKAVGLFRKLAAEYPARPEPLIRLGDILRGRDRFREAIAAYNGALARIEIPTERNWSIFYARGISLEQSKQWPPAEADLLKALELKPDQPYVLNYLGYSWVDKGLNLKKAQEMIKKAVSLRPRDGYIVDSLGWVYYRLGKYADAVREMERAAGLRPEDPVINDHLGDAYWRIGRKTEARFQWLMALGLKPNADTEAMIREKLKTGLKPPRKTTPEPAAKISKDGN
ncbi:MAG TPA: tetratricopeptide repeat protein [Alphaproteobacteria bacterium]|nr:tetratricopeptide repeat protein [Alphaproteobacteria bacterium]